MVDLDYSKLLKRVHDATAHDQGPEERFKIPKFDVFYEGNTTVIRNYDKVVDVLNRDPDHLLKFLLGNVGTAGEIQGNNRAIFQGKIPARMLQDRLEDYVNSFVICSECGRPDTNLIKKGRTLLIRCDACGAFHAIGAINKKAKKSTTKILREGDVLEVGIQDIGKRGDGVAYVDKYVIYVTGAMKGALLKIKIDKISGTMAFASIVE